MASEESDSLTVSEQFERLHQTWGSFSNPVSSDYRIGPYVLRISSVSPSLDKLTRALHHLKQEELSPSFDLEICLWDAAIEKQKLPPLDWELLQRAGYFGCYAAPVYVQWFDTISALSALDLAERRAYYVVRDARDLPWWVEGSPFQMILHVWLQDKGLQLTHVAAVGKKGRAILLAGKGGSGKSTTVLACLREGLHYLGEDYCILEPGAAPRVWSVYNSAKWTLQTRKLFPEYERWVANPDQAVREKALIFYPEIFPSQIKTSLPIHSAISLSVGSGEAPVLQGSDSFYTIKCLMMSTIYQLPFRRSLTMNALKNLAAPINHYQLSLGRDMRANVHLIEELI